MTNSQRQHQPVLKILSNDQIDQIHKATLQVLERTGLLITHPGILDMLRDAGASVQVDRVRIPRRLVADALEQSPKHFMLGKRNGAPALDLRENRSWYGAGLDCADYLDPVTHERRPFVSQDCGVTAKLANALGNYDWCMTLGFSADVLPHLAERIAAKQALTYCNKPLVCCCQELDSLEAVYEMAVLISGSETAFRKAPPIATLSSAISPLYFDDITLQKMIFCAEKGLPQIIYSGLQAGATSPATFAGTIVQGSAESLGGLVITQLISAGAPAVYGSFNTIMDMATSVFSYGAVEMNLMAAAMAQMANYYNLPFFGTAGCSDAKSDDDSQAVIEATFSCLSSAVSGAHLVHDLGLLDRSALISPSYLVLIDEILSMVNHYMHGIVVNQDTLALDVIEGIGPAGNYLAEEHTRQHFKEVWYSKLFERNTYEVWRSQGSKTLTQRVREKTIQLMQTDPEPLADDLLKKINRMAEKWK